MEPIAGDCYWGLIPGCGGLILGLGNETGRLLLGIGIGKLTLGAGVSKFEVVSGTALGAGIWNWDLVEIL